LNFQNIEVRSLLQVIADFTNFNIVTSDTVGGSLTLRLKDVPWDQALNIIMEAKGLGMKKNGNVLWIAPKDEIDERTKRDFEAARNIEQLEPLRTQGFQINYAKAEELKKQRETRAAEALKMKDEQLRILSDQNANLLQALDKVEDEANSIQMEKLAIEQDKPIQLDYYKDTANQKAFLGEDQDTKEKMLIKSNEEFTSLVQKVYKVENDYIITTENSIYLVSGKIQKRRIQAPAMRGM
jgi:hypothetical protein